jgi:uncharacterized protein YbaR (Trm112 family)
MDLECPRCRGGLAATEEAAGIVWRCGQCRGISMNFSQFRKLVPAWHANRIWEAALRDPRRAQPAVCCPECRRFMNALEARLPAGVLDLKLCLSCQRLWMDAAGGGVQVGLRDSGVPLSLPAEGHEPGNRLR